MKISYRMVWSGTVSLLIITVCLFAYFFTIDSADIEKLICVKNIILISACGAVIGTVFLNVKHLSKKKYTENGMLASWYDRNLKLMGTDWLQKILEKTIPEKMKSGEKMILANVSANKGKCELDLFNSLIERGVYPEFHLLDLCKIDRHVETVQNEKGVLKYHEERNALRTISNFEELEIELVDVLLDIKGCLWHSNKNSQEQKRAIRAFEEFYEVIKPGGILVTDAMDMPKIKAEINKFSGSIRNDKYQGYAELSTMQRLEKQFAEYPDDRKWILEHFELKYVELENRDPQIRMAIFTKK